MWRRRMTQHFLVNTRLTMIFSIVVRLRNPDQLCYEFERYKELVVVL